MRREKSAAVGVEIGGSRATIAIIDEEGQIWQRSEARTLRGRPAQATLEPYLRALDTVVQNAQAHGQRLRGIGLALPGKLDQTCRRPFLIPILPSLNQFPLSDLLETRYRLPVVLHSDVDAAAMGEYRFGAGRKRQRLLLLTVQAVVGASLIAEGSPEPAARDYTGHVCHLPVAASGPRCSCGKRGCISSLVSLEALQRMIQRAVRRGEETSLIRRLSNREAFSAQLLAEEALQGDRIALGIYEEIGHWLGVAAARYSSLFAPEVLILTDGVLKADELLLARVRATLAEQNRVADSQPIEVLAGHLRHDAALIGSVAPFFMQSVPDSLPFPHHADSLTSAADLASGCPESASPLYGPPHQGGSRTRRRSYRRPRAHDDIEPLIAEHAAALRLAPADDLGLGPRPRPGLRSLRETDV